jgi:YesN/AraC family two-component response regulator
MLDIIQSPVPFYEEEVRNLLKLSYIFLFRALFPQWSYSGRPGKRCGARMSRDKTVELIKYYIGDNISHPIKLTELAKHIGMSKDYMNRIFKEKENISIGQFITSTRIELASKMLSTTNHDVKTIAFENGFSDFNYFCTVFKKYTGLTPTRFRRLNQI